MISSNTRASRSRISSPQQGQPNYSSTSSSTPVHNKTESAITVADQPNLSKTFMQKWLEPPVQVKPSYQDAGLIRHGVVEGMAPLGTMPKVGIFKKTAAPVDAAPPRKIVLKRPAPPSTPITTPTNNHHPADDDNDTEEEKDDSARWEGAGAAKEAEVGDRIPPAPTSTSRRSLTLRDAEDEDYAPNKAASSGYKNLARRSLVPRASTGRLGFPSSPVDHQQQPSTPDSSRTSDLKAAVDKVVELAVDEALLHFRYPTAWALRTLYDENSSDPRFLTIVEEVYSQTANSETLEEFARLLCAKKKEGKKDNKGCYYFIPPSTNSRFTPHKPKRAPYANLVRLEVPRFQADHKQATRTPSVDVSDSHVRKRRRSSKLPEPSPKITTTPSKMAPSKKPTNGVNGKGKGKGKSKAKTTTPSRRRTRANSASSTSSLSSARSMTPPDGIENGDVFDVPPSRTSPAAESSNSAPATSQPIASRRRSNPSKKNGNVSHTTSTTPSSPTTTHPRHSSAAASKSSMPSAVGPSLFPNLTSKKAQQKAASQTRDKPVFPSRVGTLDQNDERQRYKDNARRITNGVGQDGVWPVTESFTRGPTPGDVPSRSTPSANAPRPPRPVGRPRKSLPASLPAAGSSGAGLTTRSTRSSRKRSHDELDDQVSPTTRLFPPSEAASTAANSRAATPSLRPAKKTRTGLRVKSSPMKKKTGTSAGIPRASGERNSPMANGTITREDDNDDYCSSCGGNGDLVCCDGCTRSFHPNCVDPPLSVDRMPAEWFCNACRIIRDPANASKTSGAFGSLLGKLDAKNSSAFRLPGDVREYFDDVRTGVDGEFEEIVPAPKPTRKRKNEEDQIPDFFRLRDNDGAAVLCHGCRKATSDNRAIVPCSLCGLWWHLDCLDPPLANPPVLRTWRCPAHIDDLLAQLPASLGPAHKFRKIKGAPPLDTSFSRGTINNGFINVNPQDDDNSGWKDVTTFGRTYTLPEKGIMLDFFEKCRSNRKGKPIPPLLATAQASVPGAPQATTAPPAQLETRSLEEQQAALNLLRLCGQNDSGLKTLVDALLSEADPIVVSMIARGNLDNIDKKKFDKFDTQSLTAMLAQVDQMRNRIQDAMHDRSGMRGGAKTADGAPASTQTAEAMDAEAAPVEPDRVASHPPVAAADGKENLPSPAATEYVTSTQPDENTKGLDIDPVPAAIGDKPPTDVGLPDGLTNEKADNGGDTATEPTSDDKTAVDDQAMEID